MSDNEEQYESEDEFFDAVQYQPLTHGTESQIIPSFEEMGSSGFRSRLDALRTGSSSIRRPGRSRRNEMEMKEMNVSPATPPQRSSLLSGEQTVTPPTSSAFRFPRGRTDSNPFKSEPPYQSSSPTNPFRLTQDSSLTASPNTDEFGQTKDWSPRTAQGFSQEFGPISGETSDRFAQTEPSVRPKIRSRPIVPRPKRKPTTSLFIEPIPSIVAKYSKADTGSPDLDLMKLDTHPQWSRKMDSQDIGSNLASKSREEIEKMKRWGGQQRERKKKLLEERFRFEPQSKRWYSRDYNKDLSDSDLSDSSESSRRRLLPRECTERDLYDESLSQPLKGMGRRRHSEIMPTGRQRYGPINRQSGLQRIRSQSLDDLHLEGVEEDPSVWDPNQVAFAERLKGLKKSDLKTYKAYRSTVDPRQNPFARMRMIPAPTGTNLMDVDKNKTREIRSDTRYAGWRGDRLVNVAKKSVLPSSLRISEDEETEPLLSIKEKKKKEKRKEKKARKKQKRQERRDRGDTNWRDRCGIE